jgi:DNA-binding CsgD family transcriptional regulator
MGSAPLDPQGDFEASPDEPLRLTPRIVQAVAGFAEECHLSERETDVLRSAAQGLSMKEAAGKLGISAKTVNDYWSRIYAKTGLRSQLAVVAQLLRKITFRAGVGL